jgi:hypothetical protein
MSEGSADAAASAKVEYQHRLDRGTTIALAALLLPVMALAIVIAEATKAHAEDRVELYRSQGHKSSHPVRASRPEAGRQV